MYVLRTYVCMCVIYGTKYAVENALFSVQTAAVVFLASASHSIRDWKLMPLLLLLPESRVQFVTRSVNNSTKEVTDFAPGEAVEEEPVGGRLND